VGFNVEETPWRSIVANMPRVSESCDVGVRTLEVAHVEYEDPERRFAKQRRTSPTSVHAKVCSIIVFRIPR